MTDSGRSYDEGCIAAHALDLAGDRWSLLIARELMLGPRRFGALRRGLPGISANILTRRLDGMAAHGLIRREMLPPPAELAVYALTPAGQGLWPVLRALCRWGAARPGHDPRRFISPAALMLSMAAMWRPDPGLDLCAGFGLGGEEFRVTLAGGRYHVARATAEGDLRLAAGSANRMAAVVYGPLPLAGSLAAGGLEFTGDPALGQRLLDGFRLGPADAGAGLPEAPPF